MPESLRAVPAAPSSTVTGEDADLPLLRPSEVATLAGCSKSFVYSLMKTGELPSLDLTPRRIGSRGERGGKPVKRVRPSALRAYLQAREGT